jgi:hypothetical protein
MSSEDEQTWMDKENAACYFRDERLKKRFQLLLKQFWMGMGQSIPFACQDWASTKAAYRFFANDHVSEKDILSGRFQCVKRAFREFGWPDTYSSRYDDVFISARAARAYRIR